MTALAYVNTKFEQHSCLTDIVYDKGNELLLREGA